MVTQRLHPPLSLNASNLHQLETTHMKLLLVLMGKGSQYCPSVVFHFNACVDPMAVGQRSFVGLQKRFVKLSENFQVF